MVRTKTLVALAAVSYTHVQALSLDVSSTESIHTAASALANSMVSYYNGNEPGNTPGVLPKPYYWWEAGAMFDTLISYFHLTSDTSHNQLVYDALVAQQGPNRDFMPSNQTASEGNDDQSTWALAAMSAAELNFPQPTNIDYASLAIAVFNEQVARWDAATCNGGLRWQIFQFNAGYNYKNSISNGNFFQLAARLARYTGNTTYSDWATKIYDWSTEAGFISKNFDVYDGADVNTNCTPVNRIQFSYAAGTYISGAAYLYNITTSSSSTENLKWKSNLDGLLNRTLTLFFPNGIATEISCEGVGTCIIDMKAMKGILAQQLVDAMLVAPYISSLVLPKLRTSAEAAASACGDGGACPLVWNGTTTATTKGNDTGLGQDLSALSYAMGLLVGGAGAPLTATTRNGTVTSGGSTGSTNTTTGTSTSTTSGPAEATQSSNVGVAVGGGSSMTFLAALLGLVSWMLL